MSEPFWLGPLVWACLGVADYSLTIYTAKRYRAQDKIVFEGSFEITPAYQRDVDEGRWLSPRFVLTILAFTLVLAVLGLSLPLLDDRYYGFGSRAYEFLLGGAILMQAGVHLRHFRNVVLFKEIDAVRGRTEYPRPMMLRASAYEFFVFAALLGLLALVEQSFFLAGGALGCASLGSQHFRLTDASATNPRSNSQ